MFEMLRFNNDQKFLVFDTETEGLNLIRSRPYQVSYIVGTLRQVIEQSDKFVHIQDISMSDDAARVTRFDMDNYTKKALPSSIVWSDFKRHLYNPNIIPVCHNLFGFDVFMLKRLAVMASENIDFSFLSRSIDFVSLAKAFKKNIPFDSNSDDDFLCWQYRVCSIVERGLKFNQALLLKELEIPFDENRLHEAMYDVTMLYELFKKMIWKVEVPNLASPSVV